MSGLRCVTQAKGLLKQQQQNQQQNKEKTSKTSNIQQNGGSPTHKNAHAHRNNRDMTSPRNILNTRTVTQPRAIDKKSDFLKALKQNDLNTRNAKEVRSSACPAFLTVNLLLRHESHLFIAVQRQSHREQRRQRHQVDPRHDVLRRPAAPQQRRLRQERWYAEQAVELDGGGVSSAGADGLEGLQRRAADHWRGDTWVQEAESSRHAAERQDERAHQGSSAGACEQSDCRLGAQLQQLRVEWVHQRRRQLVAGVRPAHSLPRLVRKMEQ